MRGRRGSQYGEGGSMSMNNPIRRKVKAAGLAGIIATALITAGGWVGVDIPPEVAAGLATIAATALAYYVPETRGL